VKQLRDFTAPTDPRKADELRRQVLQLERNITDFAREVVVSFMQRLRVLRRITNEEGVVVAPGQSVGITAGVTRVQLAAPGAVDAGKFLVVCQSPGIAVTTTVYAPAGSLISGVDTYVLPSNGRAYVFYCDGVDYWTAS
jgi:hypothetical protein